MSLTTLKGIPEIDLPLMSVPTVEQREKPIPSASLRSFKRNLWLLACLPFAIPSYTPLPSVSRHIDLEKFAGLRVSY